MLNFAAKIKTIMEAPFIYGRIAVFDNYTDREKEMQLLKNNFISLINTIIISPRRWGKTSLVNRVSETLRKEQNKEMIICNLDIFSCRTEEQFYKAFANAVLKSSLSVWDEFVAGVRKYLGRFVPNISFSDATQTYEISFGIDFKDPQRSLDEILDLPQRIAEDTGKKMVICIDEFQNIAEYRDSLAFQRVLRSHWQTHNRVCYCLFGSKRHLLMNIFNAYNMPFYKFGDILFLQKIDRKDWIKFIVERFRVTGKSISEELSGKIADTMQNHPYYTQQYSQQVWLRTEQECNESILQSALSALIDQLSLLFTNIIDNLTARQINFLLAIANNETNFSSQRVLQKYDLGSSSNIKNLKNSLLEKDLIDILSGNKIVIQDPTFEYWIKNFY